jgi:hypothetical protein
VLRPEGRQLLACAAANAAMPLLCFGPEGRLTVAGAAANAAMPLLRFGPESRQMVAGRRKPPVQSKYSMRPEGGAGSSASECEICGLSPTPKPNTEPNGAKIRRIFDPDSLPRPLEMARLTRLRRRVQKRCHPDRSPRSGRISSIMCSSKATRQKKAPIGDPSTSRRSLTLNSLRCGQQG